LFAMHLLSSVGCQSLFDDERLSLLLFAP
jgi:hypothetical protein